MDQHQRPEDTTESGKDHLRAAAKDIKEAVSAKVEDIRQAAAEKTDEFREAAQGKVQELRGAAESAWADARSQAKTWQAETSAVSITSHPSPQTSSPSTAFFRACASCRTAATGLKRRGNTSDSLSLFFTSCEAPCLTNPLSDRGRRALGITIGQNFSLHFGRRMKPSAVHSMSISGVA